MNLKCPHCHKPMTWADVERAEHQYHCKEAQRAGIQNVSLLIENIKNAQWQESTTSNV